MSVEPVTQGLKGNRVPPPESDNSPALTTTPSDSAKGMLMAQLFIFFLEKGAPKSQHRQRPPRSVSSGLAEPRV